MSGHPRDEEPRNRGGRPTDPADIAALAERRAEAWRLRSEEGMTFADIGMMLGVSTGTAMRYVQSVLAEKMPSDADVERYRAELLATAQARAGLAFERADDLYSQAEDQTLILEGPRGGVIVSTLAPQLFGRAAAWEQRGLHHLDRVARWSGVEQAAGGPDAEGLEASIGAEAERFLAVLAEVERKREAAASVIEGASVNGNGSHPA